MRDQTNNSIRAHKKFKGTNLEENNTTATILARCLHIFKLLIKNFKMVYSISISITMGEHRYNKFVYSFVNQEFD